LPGDFSARQTSLLIYDMSSALLEGQSFEQWVLDGMPQFARLLDCCRRAGVLICYAVSAKGYAPEEVCPPIAPVQGEIILRHPFSGAFSATTLEQSLRDHQRDTLLIGGMAVDRGCNTTAREALNLGIHPIVVRGICFTRDISSSPVGAATKEEIERVHLASLHRLGAGIMTVDEVIATLDKPAR